MTTWQEISEELAKQAGAALGVLKYWPLILILFGAVDLLRPLILPRLNPNAFEREGTVVTEGCRTTIILKKKPFDGNVYTCVYERNDSKIPDRITGKYCARVETESGICTLAEIYSAESGL
jgi:hypothetical protein